MKKSMIFSFLTLACSLMAPLAHAMLAEEILATSEPSVEKSVSLLRHAATSRQTLIAEMNHKFHMEQQAWNTGNSDPKYQSHHALAAFIVNSVASWTAAWHITASASYTALTLVLSNDERMLSETRTYVDQASLRSPLNAALNAITETLEQPTAQEATQNILQSYEIQKTIDRVQTQIQPWIRWNTRNFQTLHPRDPKALGIATYIYAELYTLALFTQATAARKAAYEAALNSLTHPLEPNLIQRIMAHTLGQKPSLARNPFFMGLQQALNPQPQ